MSQEPAPFAEPFVRIGAEEARRKIEAGEVSVVDVREPHEYAQGHIPGAVLVPLQRLLAAPRQYLQRDDILFVCAVGVRSVVACEMAAAIGLTRIFSLEGGTHGWAQRGYPIEA